MSDARPVSRPSRVERWNARFGRSRSAMPLFFTASVAETLLVPIPIELIMVPWMLANRARIFLVATVVLAGNLAAAVFGYYVGYFAFNSFGRGLIERMGWAEPFGQFQALFADYGFWTIVAIGVVPIPFQIAMLVAGAAGYPIVLFVVAAVLARGSRYYGLGALVYYLGDQTMAFWQRHKVGATVGAALVIAAAFFASRYV